jgi:hypothetical protein
MTFTKLGVNSATRVPSNSTLQPRKLLSDNRMEDTLTCEVEATLWNFIFRSRNVRGNADL